MARGRKKGYKMSDEHKAALLAGRSKKVNRGVLQLTKKYRIAAVDTRNWTLQKHTGISESGEDLWTSQIYYNNLAELLPAVAKRLLNRELQSFGEVSLKDLSKEIQAAEQRVLEALQGFASGLSVEESEEPEEPEDEE